MENKNTMVFVAPDVLQKMIDGKDKDSLQMLDKLFQMKGSPNLKALTSSSALYRAIYLCEDKADISNLKKVLDALTIIPSFADFHNQQEVVDETIKIANAVSKVYGKDEKS